MFHDDPQKDGDELTDEAVKDLDSPAEDSEGVSGGKMPPTGLTAAQLQASQSVNPADAAAAAAAERTAGGPA